MQNTSQAFRGSAPSGNYSDHVYDNHIGGHCQSSGYQPYSNQVYHPRPHHYANQMQQNMPYRHGGGAYAPNQQQYGSSMNQDIYRNHHPGYAASSNRNMPSKPWSENNSSYGQMPAHPQMMNNNPQMPVTGMRSPPHAANVNQPPPQGQHYRPMQSPAHSPHSWSQAQIPSPNVMHSSRTTPSPLPAHGRSPGHNQPFSPSSSHSMNLPSHPASQENGQIPQAVNSASGNDSHNPGNPLHSLQKMVLLDQESKTVMPISGDGSEHFQHQYGPSNYVPDEGQSNESKDSQFATYYNMDENRFESKPSNPGSEPSVYTSVHQVPNCNFPVPQHPVSSEMDTSNIQRLPGSANAHISENFHLNQIPMTRINSNLEQSQGKSNISLTDCSSKQNECPPHAESAPAFTDPTAAVSTNSEQALESSSVKWITNASDLTESNPGSAQSGNSSNSVSSDEQKIDDSEMCNKPMGASDVNTESTSKKTDSLILPDLPQVDQSLENTKDTGECNNDVQSTTTSVPSTGSQNCDTNVSSDCKSDSNRENVGKRVSLRSRKATINFEDMSSPDDKGKKHVERENSPTNMLESRKSPVTFSATCNQSESESNLVRNPVKVVIHRIRKTDADDTWHVPQNIKSEEKRNENPCDKTVETKGNVKPQIIMLSQDVTDNKTDVLDSAASNSASVASEDSIVEIESAAQVKSEPSNSPDKSSFNLSTDKKRGRPAGSKNKIRPNTGNKRKRTKKAVRKKRDSIKQKPMDNTTKVKKSSKIFSGPYVHIIGSKENPSSISVINVAQKEEEKLNKAQPKRPVSAVSRIKTKIVGHLSTLSPTYDAYNRDKTWFCVFCQKGSHHGGLGDLYGPYYIKNNLESKPSTSGQSAPRNKRKKSDADEIKSPKRAKQCTSQSSQNQSQTNEETENLKEVWLHEDCAIWCQTIAMNEEEVQGLEEAVTEANENKCNKCAFHGATLGCWGKGCKEMYHYTCAQETGCQMDIENFSLYCPKHQKKSSEKRTRCQ